MSEVRFVVLQGDLQNLVKKGQEMMHDRKHWDVKETLGLANLPLEVTASAMEGEQITLHSLIYLLFVSKK